MEAQDKRERLYLDNLRELSEMAHEGCYQKGYMLTDFILICLNVDQKTEKILSRTPALKQLIDRVNGNNVSQYNVLVPFGMCDHFASLFPHDELAAEIMEPPFEGTAKCLVISDGGISVQYIHPTAHTLH